MRNRFSFESLEGRLLLTTTPNDPDYAREWGLSAVAAGSAWDTTTGSASVVVADIDTGVDYKHIDLYQNIWINQSEIPSAVKKTLSGLVTRTSCPSTSITTSSWRAAIRALSQVGDGLGDEVVGRAAIDFE